MAGGGILLGGYLACTILMTDYGGEGFLTVVLFRFFRGMRWWQRLGQAAGLVLINAYLIKGQLLPFDLLGQTLEFPMQAFAVLALIPIWLYNGRQGLHNQLTQYGCYAFYPVHMLILGLL